MKKATIFLWKKFGVLWSLLWVCMFS